MSIIYQKFFKRMLDIIFAILALIGLSIPLIILAIMVKVTSRGPALFVQRRYGINSKPFMMMKFRSMRIDAPEVANQDFMDIEQYYTPIGRVLRFTSLDELPQIFNILTGKMSFIGPRPLADSDYEVVRMRQKSGADQVRPGITGLAQVNGRNNLSNIDKASFDSKYSESISFSKDLEILIQTVLNIIRKDGINSDNL